jgi:hypothetical protein
MKPPVSPSSIRELLHARLDSLLDECDHVSANSAYGQTLNDLEDFFLTKGRKFLQETFQEKLQECIGHIETTPESKQCPSCKKKRMSRTKNQKN